MLPLCNVDQFKKRAYLFFLNRYNSLFLNTIRFFFFLFFRISRGKFLIQEYFFHSSRKQFRIIFFIVLKRYTKFWDSWIEIYFVVRFKYIKCLSAKIKIPSKILHQINYPRINNYNIEYWSRTFYCLNILI